MKTKYTGFFTAILTGLFFLIACEETDERKEYPHSTPVIESGSITPATFTYGDSIDFSAKVSDPSTPLSTIHVKMTINNKVIAEQTIRTKGQSADVSARMKADYVSQLPDNATVDVELTLINVEGDVTVGKIEGITGKRKQYEKLYLVLDDGNITELMPEGENLNRFKADVDFKNKIRYRIAEKITEDDQIDFGFDVWGFQDEQIKLVDQTGDYITTSEPMKKSTESVIFDAYEFQTILNGEDLLKVDKFELSMFAEEVKQDTETYLEGSFYVEKDQEIDLASDFTDVLFNMDYFERMADDKVKYLGETGPVVLDYNASRKYMLVQEVDPTYPNVLVVCGEGLGYPSKAIPEATTGWGFDQIKQFILFRKTGDNIYQGTVYMDAEKANFKPFEDKGWGNEKRSDDYKLPDILIDSETKWEGENNDGNWFASPTAVSGNYRIVINLNTKEVTATEVALP